MRNSLCIRLFHRAMSNSMNQSTGRAHQNHRRATLVTIHSRPFHVHRDSANRCSFNKLGHNHQAYPPLPTPIPDRRMTSQPPLAITLQPSIRAETPSFLTYLPPPRTQTKARPPHPITFTQFYRQMALDGLMEVVKLEPHPHPVTDLMHFLEEMMDWLRQIVQAILDKAKGLTIWISVQVRSTQPDREIKDMRRQYRHTGKRRRLNQEELEDRVHAMVEPILLHKAHFLRQSSGRVLADFLTFSYKVCEFIPQVGREDKQLPTFLIEKKAIINIRHRDIRCFGYAIPTARASALAAVVDHVNRAGNYNHLFQKYGPDQFN